MTAPNATSDVRLGAVRTANDPARMRALLGECLLRLGRTERVEAVGIDRIFYMPGADFSACYTMTLRDGSESESQLLYGNICYDGDAEHLYAKARRKAERGRLVRPKLGEVAYHLPELDMVLWTYPNDPRLKTLHRNAQAQEVRAAMAQLHGPNGAVNGWELGTVTAPSLVRYIPRKRCVYRYEVEWKAERGPDGAPRALPASTLQHVFGKVYDTDELGREAHAVLGALWRASQTDPRNWLGIPRPLLYDPDLQLLLQDCVPGGHLAARAAEVDNRLVQAIGRGLALLHQAKVPVRPVLTLDDELQKTRLHGRLIASVHPEFASDLQQIGARLAATLPALARMPLVPNHGTFKLNHLLHDGEHVSLIDFDSVVLADPLYDLANFTADLHYLEVQGLVPEGRATRLAHSFYEAYAAQVPWAKRDAVLDWYVASLLVRKQAMKCVKHLHPNAGAKIEGVLGEAFQRLGRLAG